jgi:hypothetical protein
MKKVLALLVVLAMAAPAMAVVNFEIADGGNGVLIISYTSDAGELPRGVGLAVSIDGATADGASVLAVDAKFNTYIDYASDMGNAFAIGDGHPLAKPGIAGALDAAASEFSISAGVLDEGGDQGAGDGAAELIQIQLTGSGTAMVTISGDTTRGPASGVVGGAYESNLPISGPVALDDDCALFACHASGDTNGDCLVDSDDIQVFIGAWTDATLGGESNGIPHVCADTNDDGLVDSDDIANLVGGWNAGCPVDCAPI